MDEVIQQRLAYANQVGKPHGSQPKYKDQLVFAGVALPNAQTKFTLAEKVPAKHRFFVTKHLAVLTLVNAVGNTQAGYPLTEIVDPSPAAGTGNKVPHIDQLRWVYKHGGIDLQPKALPTSTLFGNAKHPALDQADWVVDSNSNFELICENRSDQSIDVVVVLGGIMAQEGVV